MDITESDIRCFQRAIELATEAEKQGNLPIGSVIALEGEIIAEGKNAIWSPKLSLTRHAEVEALRQVPEHLMERSREMTLYTTLEPCLMCAGAILLHGIGRVLYGSADHYGGASQVFGHMPTYFEEQIARTEWLGPAYAEECDKLFARVMAVVEKRRAAELGEGS
jgi:tRNA(adenine34) deaminase